MKNHKYPGRPKGCSNTPGEGACKKRQKNEREKRYGLCQSCQVKNERNKRISTV